MHAIIGGIGLIPSVRSKCAARGLRTSIPLRPNCDPRATLSRCLCRARQPIPDQLPGQRQRVRLEDHFLSPTIARTIIDVAGLEESTQEMASARIGRRVVAICLRLAFFKRTAGFRAYDRDNVEPVDANDFHQISVDDWPFRLDIAKYNSDMIGIDAMLAQSSGCFNYRSIHRPARRPEQSIGDIALLQRISIVRYSVSPSTKRH